MRRQSIWFLMLLQLWIVRPVGAVLPENGLYQDVDQNGIGFYVEVQGTTLVMIGYAYDKVTGAPLFYLASGTVTQAEHGISSLADVISPPPPPYQNDSPFRFEATLYRFTTGPCLTCWWENWDTAEFAEPAGTVVLRMSDINRILASFAMADGSHDSTTLYRFGFGRGNGFELGRDDGRLLPDLRGEWVFVPRSDAQATPWRFQFTEIEPRAEVAWNDFYGTQTFWVVRFVDPVRDAKLVCGKQGCALEQAGEALFMLKFWDIGADSMLGYVGDALIPSDAGSLAYRTDQLVIGKRIADPIPQAAPPPQD